jgi:glutaredoxin-like protein
LSGGKITTMVYDLVRDREKAESMGIDKIPALAVLGGEGEDYRIRFFGIPAGYEFTSLLETITMVSHRDSGLTPATREKLKALPGPLDLQVFVTPTCPYCPRAVLTAFRFAMESEKVHASMVEASEFPHLANKYQVSGVPHTVIGDGEQPRVGALRQPQVGALRQPMVGAYPEAAAIDMLLAIAQGTNAM